ncbi:MAG: DUF4405 domain-containing protein [Eubacteriales bacterium]|nr:DUF4405 domain-containing protein [Eubacteriales bacterium]MDD3880791.1 DUF4405 domain-containing protein [Eubacteriales bacterium]MDD4511842.1 DUF4405 domain-containing protein [Eubacteriales bacterium]
MKPKAIAKLTIDIAMTVLFLIQMGYHMLDNRAHEWTGVALCLLFLLHHILNGSWHTHLFKGKYNAQRILLTVTDVLLTLCMIAIIASSIMVSRHVFSFLGLKMRALGRQLHMPSTMWGFVLMGLHLGLHWSMMLSAMKRACKRKASRWAVLAGRIVLIAVCAFGAYQFIERGLWMELFRLREFAFLDYGESLLFFSASYIAILALWAAISHYGQKAVKALSQGGKTKKETA